MIGGGIFAVTGLAIELTRGAAPIAFLVAGIVALLTSYSYLKLTLAFPGEGGTVDFLNRAFGDGILVGAANILLLLSYVVLLAIYAYAFGSYGADFFPPPQQAFWLHALASGVIVGLLALNVLAAAAVIRSENTFKHPAGARSAVPKDSPERAPLAAQRRAGIRDRLQEARKRLGAA
jgi:amino acid transporter